MPPEDHQKPLEDFEWETASGEVLTLPSAGRIKAGLLRKIRNQPEVDAMFTMLETVAGDDALALIDDMELSELTDMIAAWQKAAGVSVPEVSSSSS